MRAEAELVDVVAEVEDRVVQVRLQAQFHVSVAARGDVEVALNFVPLEGAVDATGVDGHLARDARRLGELLRLVLAHVAQHVADVRVLLFGLLARPVRRVEVMVDALLALLFARDEARLAWVHPELEVGVFLGEEGAGHDAVHGGVLDVDVQVPALHRHHDVQVQLQLVAHPALHAEVVCLRPRPPCPQFRERQACAEYDDRQGPLAATCRR